MSRSCPTRVYRWQTQRAQSPPTGSMAHRRFDFSFQCSEKADQAIDLLSAVP